MKKYLCLLLLCALLCTLFGCGGEPLPEDGVLLREGEALLKKALVFNRLFFEEGIPQKEGGFTDGSYTEADAEALSALGLQKLSDIKAYMKTVYSDAATADFIRYAIDKRTDGTILVKPAYCYDHYKVNEEDPDDRIFLCLMVSNEGLHQQTDPFVYDYSTLEVVQEKKQATSATLTVSATITDRETGQVQTRTVSFRLVLEEDGWRLDNLTCLSYREKQEQLEGLDEILKKV